MRAGLIRTGQHDAMGVVLDNLGNQLTAYRVSRDVGKVSNNHAPSRTARGGRVAAMPDRVK